MKEEQRNVKRGCLGCLGIIVLIALIITAFTMCSNNKESDMPTTTEIYQIGSDAPQPNTSQMVDYIIDQGRNFAEKGTKGDATFALQWILDNKSNLFKDNATMEAAMYYGTVMEKYYEGEQLESNPRYYYLYNIGMDTVQAVKYVYRGAETPESSATKENLSQIEKSIQEINNLK